jgi:hypothetical protein
VKGLMLERRSGGTGSDTSGGNFQDDLATR